MDRYDQVASDIAKRLAMSHSVSFASAGRLFDSSIRSHIFHIYAWVLTANELVNNYHGNDAAKLLEQYGADTLRALRDSYSPNPVIHAFVLTANLFGIGKELISPVTQSLAMNLNSPAKFTRRQFDAYIYGSSQTISLMCLKVCTDNDKQLYDELAPGAESLGAAFQKVSLLRNFALDTLVRNRFYFPSVSGNKLSETARQRIVHEARHEFTHAIPMIDQLPKTARTAALVAARYYHELLNKLESVPIETVRTTHIRIADWRKAQIMASVSTGRSIKQSTT